MGSSADKGERDSRVISSEGELRHEHPQEEDICIVSDSACSEITLGQFYQGDHVITWTLMQCISFRTAVS